MTVSHNKSPAGGVFWIEEADYAAALVMFDDGDTPGRQGHKMFVAEAVKVKERYGDQD
jgi:hypothetical protein